MYIFLLTQVNFYEFSKIVSGHVICIAAVFCLQYCIGVDKGGEQVYRLCLSCESDYVSLFHPISLLRREVSKKVGKNN